MSHPPITPEEYFATIVEEFFSNPDVTPPSDGTQSKRGFGSSGLKIHNKIFAMLVRGKLVVKLPKPRVDALIASGDGDGCLWREKRWSLWPQNDDWNLSHAS